MAGGTWCATSIGTAATALVVNRPQKQVADPGAPSRGVLPLLAVEHGPDWLDHLDGQDLASTEHPEGTSMLTPGGPENRKADVHPRSFPEAAYPDGWRRLVQNGPPRTIRPRWWSCASRRAGVGAVWR